MTYDIPSTLRSVRPEWCQDMLRAHGFPSVVVSEVEAEAMAVQGAVADMARLRLTYDPSQGSGPETVIAKTRPEEGPRLAMDQAMELHERETHFYVHWTDRVELQSPRCYGVGDGSENPLLLEDLSGLRAGDQVTGLARSDAETLMIALARQHAAFWESSLCDESWLASPAEEGCAGMVAHLVGSGVSALVERYRGRCPDGAIEAVEALAPRWVDVINACATGPRTMAHNDCRLDNVFFDDDGTPVFIDWQAVGGTRGTHDVANLLAESMGIEDLRAHWEGLLLRYYTTLCESSVADYERDRCVADYRQSVLYPLGQGIALVGALDRHDGRGLTDPALLRPLLHCHDLESFATV